LSATSRSESSTADSGRLRERLGTLAPSRRIPGRNRTKADLLVYELDGCRIAAKDYGARPWWIRNTLGRWLTRRESAAYLAAEGIEGLPRYHGRLGPFRLATQWIDAQPLSAFEEGSLPPDRFDALDAVVRRLHDRGIALGDLHHRDVLVDRDGGVWVVDLATAWIQGEGSGILRRAVFERMRDQDRVALARLRARFTGADEADAIRAVGARAAARYATGRRLKSWWDRLRRR
jgi:hypothetical protein